MLQSVCKEGGGERGQRRERERYACVASNFPTNFINLRQDIDRPRKCFKGERESLNSQKQVFWSYLYKREKNIFSC